MSDSIDWRVRRRLERILEASGMDGIEAPTLVRIVGDALDEVCFQLGLQEQDALDKLSFTLHSLPVARGFLSEGGE